MKVENVNINEHSFECVIYNRKTSINLPNLMIGKPVSVFKLDE